VLGGIISEVYSLTAWNPIPKGQEGARRLKEVLTRRSKAATMLIPYLTDVSETSKCSEWQWGWESNCYCRINSAGQTEFSNGQYNEATSAAAEPTTTAIEPEYMQEYPGNFRQFSGSSMAISVPTTLKDGLQYTSTQYGSQSYISGSQNAEYACVDGNVYAETPQTEPGTSGGDSAYGWTPVSAEPTPAEQEVPESRIIRAGRQIILGSRNFVFQDWACLRDRMDHAFFQT
jgi:hypothetical protein